MSKVTTSLVKANARQFVSPNRETRELIRLLLRVKRRKNRAKKTLGGMKRGR